MKKILMALMLVNSSIVSANGSITFSDNEIENWRIVNDTVMGGHSRSQFVIENDVAIFRGDLSLRDNGGFASCRRLSAPEFFDGGIIKLKVKGDGRRYQFRLRTPKLYWGAAYVAEFQTKGNEWEVVTLSESDFYPRFRGRFISGAPRLQFSDVRQLGILIGDKIPGPFELTIESIKSLQTL